MSDSETRFALLELDIPGRPAVTGPMKTPEQSVARTVDRVNAERGEREIGAREAATARRVAQQAAAERAAKARAKQEEAEAGRRAAAAREMVAGAAAEGHGCLVAWQGAGEMRLDDLCRLAGDHGLVGPEAKSPHLLAARALRAATQGRGTVKPASRPRNAAWAARWIIATIDGRAEIGESAGIVDGAAELSPSGDLVVTGPLKQEIESAYKTLREEQTLTAGDVTHWLHALIREQGGVRVGAASYLPAATRSILEPLIGELEKQWGTWLSPTPVATSDQLLDGIMRGLADEVKALDAKLEAAREAARERGAHDIGARAGASAHKECMDLIGRVRSWSVMIGPIRCEQVLAATTSLQIKIGDICDGTVARGAMLELD
jgi:hypothetical protein